jgi:hypothetical protein
MNVKGTYTIKEYFNFTIEVDYEYYHKAQTYEDPFEDQLDIKQVRLNDIDITQFYWDYLNEDMFEEIYEYASENRIEDFLDELDNQYENYK